MADDIGLLEAIASTRAIRRYSDEPVTDQDLATILFSATRAPSGSNRQPFRFLVLRDGDRASEAKRLVGDAGKRMWSEKRKNDGYDEGSGAVANSPKARMAASMEHYVANLHRVPVMILAGLVRYREPNAYEGASVYPACQNLLLAARALGLGGVMMHWHTFVEDELRQLLEIPDEVFVAATITLGHPQGGHGPVRRRPIAELVFDGGWGDTATWAVDPEGTRFTRAGPPSKS